MVGTMRVVTTLLGQRHCDLAAPRPHACIGLYGAAEQNPAIYIHATQAKNACSKKVVQPRGTARTTSLGSRVNSKPPRHAGSRPAGSGVRDGAPAAHGRGGGRTARGKGEYRKAPRYPPGLLFLAVLRVLLERGLRIRNPNESSSWSCRHLISPENHLIGLCATLHRALPLSSLHSNLRDVFVATVTYE